MELTPGKRYRYTYTAEGVARSDKSGIDLDNGGSVEAGNFSALLERGYVELLPDPLPTTPGSVIHLSGHGVLIRRHPGVRGAARLPWVDSELRNLSDDSVRGADVLFDAGAERA